MANGNAFSEFLSRVRFISDYKDDMIDAIREKQGYEPGDEHYLKDGTPINKLASEINKITGPTTTQISVTSNGTYTPEGSTSSNPKYFDTVEVNVSYGDDELSVGSVDISDNGDYEAGEKEGWNEVHVNVQVSEQYEILEGCLDLDNLMMDDKSVIEGSISLDAKILDDTELGIEYCFVRIPDLQDPNYKLDQSVLEN